MSRGLGRAQEMRRDSVSKASLEEDGVALRT